MSLPGYVHANLLVISLSVSVAVLCYLNFTLVVAGEKKEAPWLLAQLDVDWHLIIEGEASATFSGLRTHSVCDCHRLLAPVA